MIILDGKSLSKQIETNLAERVQRLKDRNGGISPILGAILVGSDPSSAIYVRMKGNACRRVGMDSLKVEMPERKTTGELLYEIEKLNRNPDVHGILLHHPVPSHINERHCFDAIMIDKDVDAVTCHGCGRMEMGERAYGSATPTGTMLLLSHYQIPIKGKRAVVVGRSPILGKPMAMMMLNANATVTICHSSSENLPRIVKEADIIVGAVGRTEFIRGNGWRRALLLLMAVIIQEG